MKRQLLYVVESLRERGRWRVEGIWISRKVARQQRQLYANEQTPRVRVVVYERRAQVRGA